VPAAHSARRARSALLDEVAARVGGLSHARLRAFVIPERWRDYRAGDEHEMMFAAIELARIHGRRTPEFAIPRRGTDHAQAALHPGAIAIAIADLLRAEDFAYLTAPLGALLALHLESLHASLVPDGAPPPGPLVAYREPDVDPRPDHALWRHTRERLVAAFERVADQGEPDVYVVGVHLDHWWTIDDVRNAGIEILWNTQRDLAASRASWTSAPPGSELPPFDLLPWDWCSFRKLGDQHRLWSPESDPTGHELLGDYARAAGLWFTDAELADDTDELVERQIGLSSILEAGLPVVVRELHTAGEIARIFGRPLPVLFTAWDSHAPDWEWGRAANPPELYALFGPTQQRYWSRG
jgi:hypothetical protein